MVAEPQRLNGYDPEKVASYVNPIERVDRDLESEKGAYMNRCKQLRDQKKNIIEDARDAGLPKAPLKAMVKIRMQEGKIEDLRAELEPDEVEQLDLLIHAMEQAPASSDDDQEDGAE